MNYPAAIALYPDSSEDEVGSPLSSITQTSTSSLEKLPSKVENYSQSALGKLLTRHNLLSLVSG